MSLAGQLTALAGQASALEAARVEIRAALVAKGVEAPEGMTIWDVPALIALIEGTGEPPPPPGEVFAAGVYEEGVYA